MSRSILLVVLGLIAATAIGCSPRVRVISSPGPHDQGVRFYRPKPYLLVEPAGTTVTDSKKNVTAMPSDQYVRMSLEYLPDFSEEYSINVSPGLGDADVEITLDNGWNLIALNQDLDSQFDDNVKAIGELAKSAAGFVTTGGGSGGGGPVGSKRKFVVPATNVPIGYYESIIARDSCGKKRMMGWRYVGFVPFAHCPIDTCAQTQLLNCDALPSEIFGLVFENGVMNFRRLNEIPKSPETGSRNEVPYGEYEVSASSVERLRELEQTLQMGVLKQFGANSTIEATADSTSNAVYVSVVLNDTLGDDPKSKAEFVKQVMDFAGIEESLAALGNPTLSFSSVDGLPK